ncbi:MAG: hypothetical protein RR500_09735 [Bacilli bacterium]
MDSLKQKNWFKNIGVLLVLSYAFSLFMYYFNGEKSEILTFLVLGLFFINIIWTLIYYSIYLKDDKSNLKQIRIIMVTQFISLLCINFFRIIKGFGDFNTISNVLFIIYLMLYVVLIKYLEWKLLSL